MNKDFLITHSREEIQELLIGYWPQHKDNIKTRYLSLSELKVEWWDNIHTAGKLEYGVIINYDDTVIKEMNKTRFKYRTSGIATPFTTYNESEEFVSSQPITHFNLLYFSEPVVQNRWYDTRLKISETYGPWSFKASNTWNIEVTAYNWLYFRYEGVSSLEEGPFMSTNVVVKGQEKEWLSGDPPIAPTSSKNKFNPKKLSRIKGRR